MAYTVADYGLKNFRRLRRGSASDHLTINSVGDSKSVRINTRDYVQATGDTIAVSSKPKQTITTTGDVIGVESSPRVSDAGAGALIAMKADPLLQAATTGRTVSAVRGFESNIDFPSTGSAYTITNNVNAFRTFLDMGSGHTVSGKKAVFCVATPNTSGWDYLFDLEANSGVIGATTGATAAGTIKVRSAGVDKFIQLFGSAS